MLKIGIPEPKSSIYPTIADYALNWGNFALVSVKNSSILRVVKGINTFNQSQLGKMDATIGQIPVLVPLKNSIFSFGLDYSSVWPDLSCDYNGFNLSVKNCSWSKKIYSKIVINPSLYHYKAIYSINLHFARIYKFKFKVVNKIFKKQTVNQRVYYSSFIQKNVNFS